MTYTEKLNILMQTIKNGVIALASVLGIGITSIGVYNGIRSDEITLEEIKVPSSFEEQGYKSEVATVRILDQISKYQRSSGSAKERVSFFGSQQNPSTRIELAGSGIDVKAIQSFVRDSLGMVTSKMSGEITASKINDNLIYHIKIRKSPDNLVLVDFKATGTVESVIDRVALHLLEATDPHISASVYWSKGDEVNALRMIDVVLGNKNPDDDKFSLNLKAYIDLTHKRYEDAQKAIDKLEKIAPDFVPLLSSKSWMAREKGDFSESLKLAEEQIKRAPDKWWGYQAKAQSLQGQKRNDEASVAYMKVMAMKPESPSSYLNAGRFFMGQSDLDNATEAYRAGVSIFKENSRLNLAYADLMQQKKMPSSAEAIYRKFSDDPVDKLHAIIGLAEVLKVQSRKEEFKRYQLELKHLLETQKLTELQQQIFSHRIQLLLS